MTTPIGPKQIRNETSEVVPQKIEKWRRLSSVSRLVRGQEGVGRCSILGCYVSDAKAVCTDSAALQISNCNRIVTLDLTAFLHSADIQSPYYAAPLSAIQLLCYYIELGNQHAFSFPDCASCGIQWPESLCILRIRSCLREIVSRVSVSDTESKLYNLDISMSLALRRCIITPFQIWMAS